MKRLTALLLSLLLVLSLLPAAQADTVGVYFGSRQAVYSQGGEITLTLKAMRAVESDLTVSLADQYGNAYTVTLPKGRNSLQFTVAAPQTANGGRLVYTLLDGEGYVRRTPGVCSAVPRGGARYSFSEDVYQTYAGRDLPIKLRVENPGSLAEGTVIRLKDPAGREYYSFTHEARREAYAITFETDDSWVPGTRLSVWVDGRDTADDDALLAVGVSGMKAIWGVDRSDNKIAFTMDSGSHNRYIYRILDILDRYNVNITFFVTGEFAAANPEMVREMAARGHELGNHTWSHPDMDTLKKDEIYSELTRTSDLLEALGGKPVTVFRPPYGHLSGQARSIVNALGMQAVRWTHESMDARKEGSEENSLKYSTKNMKGGSIILTHTSTACTLAVLDQILQFYQDNGFEVVPVSQLLLEGDTYIDENGIQHAVK